MNADGNARDVDDKAGLERETTTKLEHNTPQKLLYLSSVKEGCKNHKIQKLLGTGRKI